MSSSVFQVAARMAIEPWSSVNDKLGALAALESLGTQEAMDVLLQVMSLTGLYVSEKDRDNPNFPIHGEVAGAASRALGRIEKAVGIEVLTRILLAPEQPQGLRECAAFGLGGLTSKQAFDAFIQALNVNDEVVYRRLLLSIRESYVRFDSEHAPHAGPLLVRLFDRTAGALRIDVPDPNAELVYSIVAKHLPMRGEAEIVALAVAPPRAGEGYAAVRVLLLRNTEGARRALGVVLSQSGHSANVYKQIGAKLKGSSDQEILLNARKAIDTYPRWRGVLGKAVSGEGEKRAAQVEAATLVLQGK
jgi:hypothetical protein